MQVKHNLAPALRLFILGMWGEKCLNCGSSKNINIDHIVPRFNEGSDSIDNLQPLCKKCNYLKAAHIMVDFRLARPVFTNKNSPPVGWYKFKEK